MKVSQWSIAWPDSVDEAPNLHQNSGESGIKAEVVNLEDHVCFSFGLLVGLIGYNSDSSPTVLSFYKKPARLCDSCAILASG